MGYVHRAGAARADTSGHCGCCVRASTSRGPYSQCNRNAPPSRIPASMVGSSTRHFQAQALCLASRLARTSRGRATTGSLPACGFKRLPSVGPRRHGGGADSLPIPSRNGGNRVVRAADARTRACGVLATNVRRWTCLTASSPRPDRGFHLPTGTWALERARLAEKLGQPEKARTGTATWPRLWRHGDPELRPAVDEAREALTRLTGEPQ